MPGEIHELERSGTVAESLAAFARQSEHEAAGFVQALGGEGRVSEQRMALIQDLARAGLLVRALLARMLLTDALELDAVAKVSTLLGVRRQGLVALGLDRLEREALDLSAYLAQRRETRAEDACAMNGAQPSAGAVDCEIDAPDPDSSRAWGADENVSEEHS